MTKIEKYKCSLCGEYLYKTDGGGPTVTLQCSSEEAKFWNFDRGTEAQRVGHEHFHKSTMTVPKKEWENEIKKVQCHKS
jgi:hypothetical protein